MNMQSYTQAVRLTVVVERALAARRVQRCVSTDGVASKDVALRAHSLAGPENKRAAERRVLTRRRKEVLAAGLEQSIANVPMPSAADCHYRKRNIRPDRICNENNHISVRTGQTD